jgi:hypothetical protein
MADTKILIAYDLKSKVFGILPEPVTWTKVRRVVHSKYY